MSLVSWASAALANLNSINPGSNYVKDHLILSWADKIRVIFPGKISKIFEMKRSDSQEFPIKFPNTG